ncbi:MAG: hypothetical protein R2712_21380 [Vicinamibacterales bacterium]
MEFEVGASDVPRRPGTLSGMWENGLVTLAWTAPTGAETDAPTGYLIEAGSSPGASDLATVPLGNVTSFQVSAPVGPYFVRVRAVNERGAGEASREIVIDGQGGGGVPSALEASQADAYLRLSWLPPTSGELPVDYVIEAGSRPGLTDLGVLHAGTATEFLTTLPPGQYYLRVRAVTPDGRTSGSSNDIGLRR